MTDAIPDDPRGSPDDLEDAITDACHGWQNQTIVAALLGVLVTILRTADPPHRQWLTATVHRALDYAITGEFDA